MARVHGRRPGQQYSPLDQINAANFNKLEVAWRFKTDNLGTRPEYKLEGTPLMVEGRSLHDGGHAPIRGRARRQDRRVDVGHSLREGTAPRIAPRQLSGRGVSYWTDGKGDDRIMFVTTGYRLVALNAKTGSRSADRSAKRHVDLKEGVVTGTGQQIDLETGEIGLHATPTVVKDVVIVGSSFKEGMPVIDAQQHQGSCARLRRAHRQAAVDLQHHPPPRRVRQRNVGERFLGHQRQHRRLDADHRRTKSSAWSTCRSRIRHRIIRRPPPRQQSFRRKPGLRGSENRPAQVALPDRASSDLGSRLVLGADPRRHHGQRPAIKAVALPSKEAFLYVFDRVTGQPVWPIEERPVPQSDVPGEKTSPTQPFPTKPPAYARQAVTVDDLIDFTPELRAQALEAVKMYRMGRCSCRRS